MMDECQHIEVSVAFAPTAHQHLLQKLILPLNTTVFQAIEKTGWLVNYPEIEQAVFGIFSQKVTKHHRLTAGDRIEIYRPLTIDPMNKRKIKHQNHQKLSNS